MFIWLCGCLLREGSANTSNYCCDTNALKLGVGVMLSQNPTSKAEGPILYASQNTVEQTYLTT